MTSEPLAAPADPADPAALDRLADLLARGPVAVLSGAGLSTASGIPAYRDADGQWRQGKPIQHQDFLRSETTRRRYWARSFAGWPAVGAAQPNAGHRALAALDRRGLLAATITQNVDGLHQRAGSASVVELHGGIARVRCLGCGTIVPRAAIQDRLAALNPGFDPAAAAPAPDGDARLDEARLAGFRVPVCEACGGVLKPDVVFFGDGVPKERVEAARRTVDAATALLVVGSSLMVWSGYRFAEQAHRAGKPVAAINRGVTRADALLAFKIDADCGATLAALDRRLRSGSPTA